jgi:ligand-binding SRPBCC domain-containing protein
MINDITITRHGKGYRLSTTQRFPRARDEVFPFFADAGKLEEITPPHLNFQILSPLPINMRCGALIDYKIRLRGIPIHWRTEISIWEPPSRFVDRQLRGPYKWWIHEHTFEECDGQTLATDVVEYGVLCGSLAHPLFVKHDLRKIFQYRQRVLAAKFAST